ncbi:MAG: RNA polymerase sigma factor [Lachnospiraceae bacterium]
MLNMDSIYKEYAQIVYKFLMSLCYEEDTAEELTQETFYQAVRCSNKYDGTCKVSTWLCQIAKHLWYRELEHRKKKKTETLTEEIVSISKSPDEEICIREEKMELFRKVHILDETAKEVVLLRITGAFSFREIGELFGKNENWARVTYYRAKQKIVKGEKQDEM